MTAAGQRLFDVVLVWKFDRFARSLKHLIDSLEEFRALGIDFISNWLNYVNVDSLDAACVI